MSLKEGGGTVYKEGLLNPVEFELPILDSKAPGSGDSCESNESEHGNRNEYESENI